MEVLLKVLKYNTNDHFNEKWPEEASMKVSSVNLVHNRPKGRLMKTIFPFWMVGTFHEPTTTTQTCRTLTTKDTPSTLR